MQIDKYDSSMVGVNESRDVHVSVVLVGLNSCKFILECIDSLRAARWPECTFEVIYVDNGSRDDSVSEVGRRFPDVNLIANPSNLGYCPAANQGARGARGAFLFFLNDDTLVLDDAIARAMRTLMTTPGAGIIGSRLLNIDRSDQWSGRRFPTMWAAILGRRSMLAQWFPNATPLADYLCKKEVEKGIPFDADWVSAAALMVKTEDFWSVNGFAEDYYYWHEAVFCDRMRAKDKRVLLDPLSLIVHYEGKGSGKRTYKTLKWHIVDFHKGAFRCFCEHYGISMHSPLRALIAVGLASRAAMLLVSNWFTAPRN